MTWLVLNKWAPEQLVICFLKNVSYPEPWIDTIIYLKFLNIKPWILNKPYKPRSDATECDIWSGSTFFALIIFR